MSIAMFKMCLECSFFFFSSFCEVGGVVLPEIEFMANQHFLKCTAKSVCMHMCTSCICKLEFIYDHMCVFPWARAYCISGHDQISIMPTLCCHFWLCWELLTLPEALCVFTITLVPLLPAPTCLPLHYFANGKHFSVGLTLLMLFQSLEQLIPVYSISWSKSDGEKDGEKLW